MRRSYLLPLGLMGILTACSDTPVQPAAIQDRLTLESFPSCNALESYIEDEAVRDMQLQLDCIKDGGWCGSFLAPEATAAADSGSGPRASGPSAYTKTNTQVAGVDEADFMKNDGTRIFVLSGQKLRAVKSWPADKLSPQGSLSIEGYPSQMYLDEKNRVVVFSAVYTKYDGLNEGGASGGAGVADLACRGGIDGCGYYYSNTTKVTVVDVTDISNLKVVSETYLPGTYANSRRIDGSVRMVLSDRFRYPSTVQFWPSSTNGDLYQDKGRWNSAIDTLKAQNEKLIRAQTLSQWLPPVKRKLQDGKVVEVPYACGDFYKSNAPVHLGLVTVATVNLDAPEAAPSRSTVLGEVGEIYASASSLYIASPHWWWWPAPGQKDFTYVHKFDLADKNRAVYVASGGVEGHIVDQFAMDEDKGYFRIATTLNRRVPDLTRPDNRWGTLETSNRISVMGESSGQLVTVGQSEELAKGERIFSARFLGDRGFVVTYRQVDPLFTFDLSRPSAPRQVGELKVPGFSTYIHPLDANHLLTLGVYQPDPSGGPVNWNERRLQLSLFDVTELKSPRQTFTHLVGTAYGWSDATYDHHAFNYFPERKLLAIPFSDYDSAAVEPWNSFVSEVRVFGIDTTTGITPRGAVSQKDIYIQGGTADWTYWYTPWIRRSVMASDSGRDYVYSVSDAGIRSADLAAPGTPLSTVVFPREPLK